MCSDHDPKRRTLLKGFGTLGLTAATVPLLADASSIGALVPGKGWVEAGERCEGDGTPLQFIPKTPPDPAPLQRELEKYPRCPYCGMSRTQWHHSRHLVHYEDDLVDGTCSIHCLAISLMLNLDRGPKAIYAADSGATQSIKPLIPVEKAIYLIGSKLRGTMTANSKRAFGDRALAAATQEKQGGKLGDFEEALQQTYLDMARDTRMIRKRRAERRQRMQKG